MIHRQAHRMPPPRDAEEPPGHALSQTTRLIVSAAGVLLLFYCARSVVLPILLAVVTSMVLRPPVTWLCRHHVPAPAAAALILAILGTVLACGLVHLERPVVDWVKSAPQTLPRLREKYQRIFDPVTRMTSALYGIDTAATNSTHAPVTAPSPQVGGQIPGTLFTWTGSVLAGVCETVVLLFLLLASGDRLILKFARLLQSLGDKTDAMEICRQIQGNVSTYLFSITLINTVFGIAVGLSLSLAGLPNAAMWGALAAFANFVPYFGPVAGAMAVAGAGLLAFDTVTRGLLPAGLYLVCHVLEADLITPYLLGRRFKMNAFVIFVMLMFCTWLWGVLGTLLAMPMLVTLKVVCSRVPACSALGDFLSA
jgi:predicted PurR-regulated permease PerM